MCAPQHYGVHHYRVEESDANRGLATWAVIAPSALLSHYLAA